MKRKIPDALALICHYCFFPKNMGWKHTAYHIINSDPCHTRSKQQLDKTLKITFVQKHWWEGEREKKKKGNCKALCVTRKRKNKFSVKVIFKIRFSCPKILHFAKETFLIEGLPHRYWRIIFADWKILTSIIFQNISSITSQIGQWQNAYETFDWYMAKRAFLILKIVV